MEAKTDAKLSNKSNDIASWNIQRTIYDLRAFISSRDDMLDVEDFYI